MAFKLHYVTDTYLRFLKNRDSKVPFAPEKGPRPFIATQITVRNNPRRPETITVLIPLTSYSSSSERIARHNSNMLPIQDLTGNITGYLVVDHMIPAHQDEIKEIDHDELTKSLRERYEASLADLNSKAAEIKIKAQQLYDTVHNERRNPPSSWSYVTRNATNLDKLLLLLRGYVSLHGKS